MLSTDQQAKLDLLRTRFVHRTDVYAVQWWSKARNDGGWFIPRVRQKDISSDPLPLTDRELIKHVRGADTVGVYQLGSDDTVKWLCFDVDVRKGVVLNEVEDEVQEVVRQLRTELRTMRIPSLLEGSTNKGYHLWVFFTEPVPAAKVKSLGDFIVSGLDLPEHIGIEVFPKQVHRRSYGNLVRMPLGIHPKTGKRCLLLGNAFEVLDDQWGVLAQVPTVDEATLDALIQQHDISLQTIRVVDSSSDLVSEKNPRCIVTLFADGADFGMQDRSAFQLACYLRDRGIPFDLAESTMLDWNRRNTPPMEEQAVSAKVESAFRDAYSPYPCSVELFDAVCSSDCVFYEEKMKTRNRRKLHKRP